MGTLENEPLLPENKETDFYLQGFTEAGVILFHLLTVFVLWSTYILQNSLFWNVIDSTKIWMVRPILKIKLYMSFNKLKKEHKLVRHILIHGTEVQSNIF